MAKFRVKTDFHSNRMYKRGEIYNPVSKHDELHLLRTNQIEEVIEEKPKKISQEKVKVDSLGELQKKYEKLTGNKPHHLWKEARIKEEISKL